MRYIGIDYGTRKTGIALSDEGGMMGFPHRTFPTDVRLIEELVLLVREKKVGAIVMGESKNFKGNDNAVTSEAKRFAEELASRTEKPLYFESETMTTQAARRFPDGSRMPGSPDVDASAAALILSSFLENIHNSSSMEKDHSQAEPESLTEKVRQEPAPAPLHISIDDFAKVQVKVGTVLSAERVPETDKLLRLMVDLGEENPRQIVSGIAGYVEDPQMLVGRQLSFVANLAPRKIKGLESNGMLFAVGEGETFAFMVPDRIVPPGTGAH